MNESLPSSDTRMALLGAALHLFGRRGFDGTSTRAIAERAGANVASIAYHFGSKDGLRLACAELLVARLGAVSAPAHDPAQDITPDVALAEIETTIRNLVQMIVGRPETRDMVAFILRELTEPGAVAELIFERFFEPRHAYFCHLWSVVTGQPADADFVKLSVFSLIGQIVYFRVAEPFVARRMGWGVAGPEEADKVADLIVHNLNAMIERSRR